MPPLIGSWLRSSPNSTTARLIRACSGGIILSLALVGTGTAVGVVAVCWQLSVCSNSSHDSVCGCSNRHT
jgi:hypothetical protein